MPVPIRALPRPIVVTAGLAIALVLAAVLALVIRPAPARAASPAASTMSPFDTNLRATFRVCLDGSVDTDPGYQRVDLTEVFRCLGTRGYSALAFSPPGAGNLTSRGPAPSHFEWDLFSTFTSCLSEAAGGDSMYPGINPREVNLCLERYDVY